VVRELFVQELRRFVQRRSGGKGFVPLRKCALVFSSAAALTVALLPVPWHVFISSLAMAILKEFTYRTVDRRRLVKNANAQARDGKGYDEVYLAAGWVNPCASNQ
jgi:hypothetical protein